MADSIRFAMKDNQESGFALYKETELITFLQMKPGMIK